MSTKIKLIILLIGSFSVCIITFVVLTLKTSLSNCSSLSELHICLVDEFSYKIYKAKIDQMDEASTVTTSIHPVHQAKYDHIFKVDLDSIVIKKGNFFNSSFSLCSKIFLPNNVLIKKVSKGEDLDYFEEMELFHELFHAEQCIEVGGEKSYAIKYVRQGIDAMLQNPNIASWFISDSLWYDVPLEQDAEERSTQAANSLL